MTNKKTTEVTEVRKKGGKLIKFFLFIIFIFILGLYFAVQHRPEIVGNTNPDKTQNTNLPKADNELIQEALEDTHSVGAEPPIMTFAPEEEAASEIEIEIEIESDATIEEEASSHPYEEIVEVESKAFNSSALKSKFNEYRVFLNNANILIAKYKAEKDSGLEIVLFKKHIHPAYINETISLLETYNKLIIEAPVEETKKNDSMQAKLLAKFVKIRKVDSMDSDLLDIKSKIDKRLDVFTNYLYSQTLQDNLVK